MERKSQKRLNYILISLQDSRAETGLQLTTYGAIVTAP